ncbi:MAG: pentapeptide repeat-containing protein [Rhizomicrobium sp.]
MDLRGVTDAGRQTADGADRAGAQFYGLNLEGASLQGSNLSGADLRSCKLGGADLRGVNFAGARLAHADFRDAKIGPLMISDARLLPARMDKANARYADFRGADLRRVRFSGADLAYANLSDADLRRRRSHRRGHRRRQAADDLRRCVPDGGAVSLASAASAVEELLENAQHLLPARQAAVHQFPAAARTDVDVIFAGDAAAGPPIGADGALVQIPVVDLVDRDGVVAAKAAKYWIAAQRSLTQS